MSDVLPDIPEKRYFTIGEVAYLCDLKTHVLRYWEQEFPQLSPNKRKGNRRYYQHEDVVLIRRIRHLLYHRGFTINGARQQLKSDEIARKQASQTVDYKMLLTQTMTALNAILEDLV